MDTRAHRPRRPAPWQWQGAMLILSSLHVTLGWVPPSVIVHTAALLGVEAKTVVAHWRAEVRQVQRRRPCWLTGPALQAVADRPDFPSAYRRLLELRVRAPYASVEAALWEGPEFVLGDLQTRERARRDPSQPCPLCRTADHQSMEARAA